MIRCQHCGGIILPKDQPKNRNVLNEKIVNTVTGYFKTDLNKLQVKDRHRIKCYPRQVLMYFLRHQTKNNLKAIGDIFKLDHTTVVHACKTIDDLIYSDFMVRQDIANIETLLNFNQE